MPTLELVATQTPARARPLARLYRIFETLASALPAETAFDVVFDGEKHRVGDGQVRFRLTIENRCGMSALRSLDQERIGEAYLNGDISVGGCLTAALHLRAKLTGSHPLARLWANHGRRLLFGQMNCDKARIQEHDIDSEFYLRFLDPGRRCHSHGYFETETEPLERAIRRKLDTAIESCGMKPGWRVLDAGAGWGAFTEHAGKRGIRVTSLTISGESERYVDSLIARQNLPCRVIREHLLEHKSDEPYDAIVNLGATEHLSGYPATLAQYRKLLKPGGRVFVDACASRSKHPFSPFVLSQILPGNATPLRLSDYLDAVARTPFEVLSVRNDGRNYLLTAKHWAENLDRHRDEIVARWGERLYRRFRLYLWGCVHALGSGEFTAYRLLLELPADRGQF